MVVLSLCSSWTTWQPSAVRENELNPDSSQQSLQLLHDRVTQVIPTPTRGKDKKHESHQKQQSRWLSGDTCREWLRRDVG